jgi:BirA family biotin operon repressor/biotin-[acetyl-CoA-carboxylase] ligase
VKGNPAHEAYTAECIASGLSTRAIGRYIRWHDTLASTNDLAKRLADIPVPEGTVILAEEQTAGRGRLGRPWVSPRGGIWLSVVLRPDLPLVRIPLIGLAASIAVAGAIRATTGLLARIKWPNDVLIGGQKVAGILVEAGPGADWVVVGIGINANVARRALPDGTAYPVTSLEAALGRPVDRCALVRVLLLELERQYDDLRATGAAPVVRRWREITDTLGRRVRVEIACEEIEGLAADIDERGALLVQREDGTRQYIIAGEITVREVR